MVFFVASSKLSAPTSGELEAIDRPLAVGGDSGCMDLHRGRGETRRQGVKHSGGVGDANFADGVPWGGVVGEDHTRIG